MLCISTSRNFWQFLDGHLSWYMLSLCVALEAYQRRFQYRQHRSKMCFSRRKCFKPRTEQVRFCILKKSLLITDNLLVKPPTCKSQFPFFLNLVCSVQSTVLCCGVLYSIHAYQEMVTRYRGTARLLNIHHATLDQA